MKTPQISIVLAPTAGKSMKGTREIAGKMNIHEIGQFIVKCRELEIPDEGIAFPYPTLDDKESTIYVLQDRAEDRLCKGDPKHIHISYTTISIEEGCALCSPLEGAIIPQPSPKTSKNTPLTYNRMEQ